MDLCEKARKAPHLPGVYTFRAADGTPNYIGKAKDLRARLSSYFASNIPDKTRLMLQKSHFLDWTVTDSEAEALLLESSMIKRHYPKYNIELRDNDRFTYIRITDEKYPRMELIRKARGGKMPSGGKIFGPFTSGSAHVLVASTLRKAFKIRTCRPNQGRLCLQYHLGYCTGVCAGLISAEEYNKGVARLADALSGGKKLECTIATMDEEMRAASKKHEFERALPLRNSIRALSSLLEHQKMESATSRDEDFIACQVHGGIAHVQLFRQIAGVIRDQRKYSFPLQAGAEALSEFLPRFYDTGGIPRTIYVSDEPASLAALEEYLSRKRNGQARIVVPGKGDKKKLLDLLQKNISLEISGQADASLLELERALPLPTIPRVIECFDISNLFGTSVVGALSRFVDGKPDKAGYRRFRIRGVGGQDDFASIREIVYRRYFGLKKRGEPLPDLIVIDGGVGQLNAALSALGELSLSIPCVSLAKEFEEIYVPFPCGKGIRHRAKLDADSPERSEPLTLPRSSSALKLLQHARDEAHRFVISYHRLLRKKSMKE